MPDYKSTTEFPLGQESIGLEARISKEDHQSIRVWLRLLSCSTEIEAEIRRRLRSQFHMSLARFDYLAQLHRHREGLSMRTLSRYLMVTGGNVTGLTDDLEKEGLVAREMSTEDRRSYSVRLTPSGRKKFEEVASIHEAWVVELFAGLKASEREQLNGLLGQLRLHLAQSLNGPREEKKPAAPGRPTAARRRRAV
ncbi:MarR family winged helix-turn-helix transcriptional regulator [Cupriavidus campinensis]|uniref:Transcriptional regulator n=1 Tax=Delftia tsuruhatensis TaxID=180282 RepID=Q58LX1_9BURK|nr:MarR family transcriptional regulator [Cupriavidus campinensis]AAX47259.1 transcriptional regulator [Delftia tsuruhatensis]